MFFQKLVRAPVLWTVDLMFCACFYSWKDFRMGKFCDFWHNSALYLAVMTYEEKSMTHIGPSNRASKPDWKLKLSTLKNPKWRSLTDKRLTKQHWQPVFLFSKPIVNMHVCCSYIELARSKLCKTGDLQVGNWHVNCQHSTISCVRWRHPCRLCLWQESICQ